MDICIPITPPRRMTPDAAARRRFLSGLASLPLIGGAVALIGSPVRAAVQVTDDLHARYLAFLAHEHWAAQREHYRRSAVAQWRRTPKTYEATAEAYADRVESYQPTAPWWMPSAPDVLALVGSAPASSRAAVILSAAGLPLAEAE